MTAVKIGDIILHPYSDEVTRGDLAPCVMCGRLTIFIEVCTGSSLCSRPCFEMFKQKESEKEESMEEYEYGEIETDDDLWRQGIFEDDEDWEYSEL